MKGNVFDKRALVGFYPSITGNLRERVFGWTRVHKIKFVRWSLI